jgi:hypothetical protein
MLGRDSRALSKLFEEVANSLEKYERMLFKAQEVTNTPQKKFIVGLKY